MKTNINDANKLWDEFLAAWPIERVKSMTLSEYTNVGNSDTFTYWMEFRLEPLGSIRGGSSFKFGVYERKDTDHAESSRGRAFGDKYAWYSNYGDTADQAFEKVKGLITKVAEAARIGDLETIDQIDIGDAYKWKIAFHYQDRSNPKIMDIFIKDALAYYLNEQSATSKPFSYLHKAVLAKQPTNQAFFDYVDHVWNHWQSATRIWKISHGTRDFSSESIQEHLNKNIISIHKDTAKGQGEAFKRAMRQGDLFYLCHGNEEILLIGKIVSDVIDNSEFEEGWIARKYEVLKRSIKKSSYSGDKKGWAPNFNGTLKLVPTTELAQFESMIIKPFFNSTLSELVALESGDLPIDMVSELSEVYSSVARTKTIKEPAKNLILYGPPGTGKTYKLLQLLKNDYTDVENAMDPELWLVDQIKTLGWFEVIALVLLNENKPLKVPDIVRHKFFQAKVVANDRSSNLTHTAWACLQRHTWSKSQTVELSLERRAAIAVFDKDSKSNWFVVEELKEQLSDLLPTMERLKAGPKAGAIAKRYEFITFHQSYGYEEFVEGLRPVLEDDATDQVRYEIKHGPLRQLCDLARADKTGKAYALVIDEINRGNISKIFGELITLIEIDKREGSELAVPAKLPYSGDSFIIPQNVHFIGSMNTADRSLALVDTALRRRFEFEAVLPDPNVLKGLVITVQGMTIEVQTILTKINERIEALYDRDHTIGHAYFTNILKLEAAEQFPSLKATFKNKIIPLLEEYFFEDWQKIRLVLGDNQKVEKYQFIQEVNREADLSKLFGSNHELDQYAIRARYRLNEESIAFPESFIGIYSPSSQSSSGE